MLKLYAFLFIVAILSGVGYGAYYYYNDTQTRIAILRENNAKLETVNKQVTVEFEQYRENVTKEIKNEVGFLKLISDTDVAKVSVIGIGMQSQSGVAQKMFDTLAEKSINLKVISTSEIKISVLIEASYMELAVRSLHSAFGLDED